MSTDELNISSTDTEMLDSNGDKVVTMMDVLQEEQDFEEDANAVLGASDDKECTYSKGYIKRQAIYACLTCCNEARMDPEKRAGVCLACSLSCHENHELVELYTKRNFRCDCGNPKFNSHPCQFTSNKTELNIENKYNQNFAGLYCVCSKPYPDNETSVEDEMIQCIVCEDWLHSLHLDATVPSPTQYAEMICKACMDKNEFLHDYSEIAVISENGHVDVINDSSINNSLCNGKDETINDTIDKSSTELGEIMEVKTLADEIKEETVSDAKEETVSEAKEEIASESKEETVSEAKEDNKLEISGDDKTSDINVPEPKESNNSETTETPVKEATHIESTDNSTKADEDMSERNKEQNQESEKLENLDCKENVKPDASEVSEKIENADVSETSNDNSESKPEVEAAKKEVDMTESEAIITKENSENKEEANTKTIETTNGDTSEIIDNTDSTVNEDKDQNKPQENGNGLDDSKKSDSNDVTMNNVEEVSKSELENSEVSHKRKLSTEAMQNGSPKKAKLTCCRPTGVPKTFKGATFWPANFRSKLCTCSECISMYKDLSVLFLTDLEDTVTAYETLGKQKANGGTQYEQGLQALYSLDRTQQINALTEYNNMRDKLLDFLKSFKDRKEIVKEEDIKAFFAGMKPKRENDGVYFCR